MFKSAISNEAIAQIFTEARTYHSWTDKIVSDETLKELYETVKWGPTAVNGNPARFLFIKSESEKEKLYPHLRGSNSRQVKEAPVTVIVAFDENWLDHVGRLFPSRNVRPEIEQNKELVHETAFRNSTLQGAYLLLASRALGLDICAMSGFDNAAVDEVFFKDMNWKSNFIFTLGYGDDSKLWPREPRFEFDEVCIIK